MLTVDPRHRATINDVAVHKWVGLEPDMFPGFGLHPSATAKIKADHNDSALDGKTITSSKTLPVHSQTPKSILKHKPTVIFPTRPHSMPATPNMADTLADQLAAVCGLNTKDSLVLRTSNVTTKRRMLRPRRERESGYYSSPEQMQFFPGNASISEPTLTQIGETSSACPTKLNAVRASWPNSSEHSSSLPSGMSTCGLVDARMKQRYTSVSSDDTGSIGSVARPESTYSDSSVLSSDSFDVGTFDRNVTHPVSLPYSSTLMTPTGPHIRPLTLSLSPDTLPHPAAKDLERHASGSLTPKSENFVRDLERILAPSKRRRTRHGVRVFEPISQVQASPQFLPVIADLNDNFECKKGIDSVIT